MSLGNPLGSLIDSICHINLCGTWLGDWKIPLALQLGPFFDPQLTWHAYWHTDETLTWKLDGQVSCKSSG